MCIRDTVNRIVNGVVIEPFNIRTTSALGVLIAQELQEKLDKQREREVKQNEQR